MNIMIDNKKHYGQIGKGHKNESGLQNSFLAFKDFSWYLLLKL